MSITTNRRSFLKISTAALLLPEFLFASGAEAKPAALSLRSQNWSKLADEWEAKAPFGITADGEIAPGMAISKDGDPIEANQWTARDFYSTCGEMIGYTPTEQTIR